MADAKKAIQIVISAKDEASKVISNLDNSVSGLSNTVKAGAIASVAAFTAIGAGAYKLATDAGRFESVKDSFNGMAKEFNVSAEQIISDVKKSTRNTVSEFDILRNATSAMTLIGKNSFTDFGSEFNRMATIAKKAARATGQDVDFMFESIVRGVGRASPLILDNLGITVRAEEVYDAYAQTLGKSANDLTSVEQKQALLNAVLAQGEEKYRDVAVSAGGLQGKQQELGASIEDLKKKIGLQLQPTFIELETSMIKILNDSAPRLIQFAKDANTEFQNMQDEIKSLGEEIAGDEGLNRWVNEMRESLEMVWQFVKPFILPMLQVMIAQIQSMIERVKQLDVNWDALGDVLKFIGTVVAGVIMAFLMGLMAIITAIAWAVEHVIVPAVELWIKNFTSLVDTVKNVIKWLKDAYDWIGKVFGGKKSATFEVKTSGGTSKQHGGFINAPFSQEVPAMLHGGERVIPRNGVDVNNTGGGSNISINFTGPVSMDSNDRVDELAKRIVRILGRQNELAGVGLSV